LTLLVGALNVMKLTREFRLLLNTVADCCRQSKLNGSGLPAATTLTVNVAPVTTVMTGAGGVTNRGVESAQ